MSAESIVVAASSPLVVVGSSMQYYHSTQTHDTTPRAALFLIFKAYKNQVFCGLATPPIFFARIFSRKVFPKFQQPRFKTCVEEKSVILSLLLLSIIHIYLSASSKQNKKVCGKKRGRRTTRRTIIAGDRILLILIIPVVSLLAVRVVNE